MKNIMEINSLTKTYKSFKLDNINITLPEGAIMGFIGENGAGKSTTIKLILNLIKKDSGKIKIFNKDLSLYEKNIKEHIGVVFDENCFSENLSSGDIDKILGKCYKTWDTSKFNSYLEKFSIPFKNKIKEYSRGMKMKLSLAAALSHDSKLLILDEATSGLDPIIRDEILDEFLDFIQDETHSIFISSHIISDLEKICDYITLIHNGRIIFSEPKDDIIEKYTILKCTKDEFKNLDKNIVIGSRENKFGIEALVYKNKLSDGYITDNVGLEEIMLYFTKEMKI